jgi:hypothetical protein
VAREADDAHVVTEVFSAELRADPCRVPAPVLSGGAAGVGSRPLERQRNLLRVPVENVEEGGYR